MSEADRPRRLRITSPHTSTGAARQPRRAAAATARAEIAEETSLGRVYVDALVRTQLRLALLACAGLAVGVGAVPALFLLVPAVGQVSVLGLPLPWLLLGVLVYPALVLAAWWHVRAAERAERHFRDLVGPR
ncbi:MAG: hypothetical protein ACTHMZ_03410 [Actinomycetes bacterium]